MSEQLPETREPQEETAELRIEDMLLNLGPSHPTTHGIIRLILKVSGEYIRDADIEIGYLHRGFEKMCEQHNWNQAVVYTDRLNYVSPIINNVAYALAVEKLLDIEVPPRGGYVRMIMSEIMRIADHLTALAAASMEVGAFTAFLYMMKGREILWELLEKVVGGRVTTSFTRIGGVTADLPEGFRAEAEAAVRDILDINAEIHTLLTRNRIFIDRTRGIGVINREDSISYGFTGPMLRAVGVEYDVRIQQPYLYYHEMDFDVPIMTNGDVYDRYYIRMEEIEQSCRIILQGLEKLPGGPVNITDKNLHLPPKEEVYGSIEGLMAHFKLLMKGNGIRPPVGEVYHAVEGANGELGFYLVSTGDLKPHKCRVRPACMPFTQALPQMVTQGMIADVVPCFGSINMIGGELDR
jgi:NADH-quinone oxidoreductase subunit D